MSASLASDLSHDFEPRSSVLPRPQLSLVAAPVAGPARASESRRAFEREQLVALIPALRRRARRFCRDAAQAEDLLQETLLRAWAHDAPFENDAHAQAWLYTVLHNLFISRRRREQSARRALGALGATLAEGVFGWVAPPVAFLLPSLERALAHLPEPFSSTLRLVDLEEHSYAEAAALLGVPVGTVMSRLFRGRRRLAQILAREAPRTGGKGGGTPGGGSHGGSAKTASLARASAKSAEKARLWPDPHGLDCGFAGVL